MARNTTNLLGGVPQNPVGLMDLYLSSGKFVNKVEIGHIRVC